MPDENRVIRPNVAELRNRPTLAVMTRDDVSERLREVANDVGVDFRLELKLDTPEKRYWLCTAGASEPTPGVPGAWVIGAVSIENTDDGDMMPYTEATTTADQRLDYARLLWKDIERLAAAGHREPTNETIWAEHAAVVKELNRVRELYRRERDDD